MKQGAGVTNIEITDANIKSFEPYARKYGIDFALKKDATETPPKWLVFFKAKDADAMTAAFKEFTAKAGVKLLGSMKTLGAVMASPFSGFTAQDLLIGLIGAVIVRAVVYFKGKNAKKYRHGIEYGSARWGTEKDIKPFIGGFGARLQQAIHVVADHMNCLPFSREPKIGKKK